MTKKLPLLGGLFALVDDEDFESLTAFSWFVTRGISKWPYAVRSIRGRPFSLHRQLMGAPQNREVDHINGDTLDNRRKNLRICSHKENLRNKSKQAGTTLSRFKGVSLSRGRWRAQIEQNGVNLRLGTFSSEFAAARQYDRAARVFFGSFAKTNEEMGLFEGAEDRAAPIWRAKPESEPLKNRPATFGGI